MTAPTIPDVVTALEQMHGDERWHWTAESDPFEVAVGAILVQHTTWTNAERAIDRLREAGALEPERLAELSDEAMEELVRPSGQYRAKASKLRAFLDLIAGHGSLETPSWRFHPSPCASSCSPPGASARRRRT